MTELNVDELVSIVQRLLRLAERDERRALMVFHHLVDTHGTAAMGAALTAAAPDEMAELGLSPSAH